ncbi:MAG: hypothetical protein ACFE9R_01635 [Candidatus Hermodarchaeota archaeon]
METINKFETMAQENLRIAKQEKALAKESKLVGEIELKRAKARESLVEKELELARIKRAWAEKKINLVIDKRNLKNKGYIGIQENDLKSEEKTALFSQKISIIQEQIAQLDSEVAFLEKKIAKKLINLVNDKLEAVKEREKLSKIQENYVKDLKTKVPEINLTKDLEMINNQEKALNKARSIIVEEETAINNKHNELANLKKELSLKLSEREKIRPGQNDFDL